MDTSKAYVTKKYFKSPFLFVGYAVFSILIRIRRCFLSSKVWEIIKTLKYGPNRTPTQHVVSVSGWGRSIEKGKY